MMEEYPKVSPALLRALDPATGAPEAPPVKESFARMQAKLQHDVGGTDKRAAQPSRRPLLYATAGIVAAFVVGISGIQYFLTSQLKSGPTTVSRMYKAALGQSLSFALDDGTRVSLAPGTTLKITGTNAELDGEAAFTVNHNKSRSFTVNAKGYRIAVLGTRFAVRAYDEDVRVAVADGKVAVGSSILAANEVGYVSGGEMRSVQLNGVEHMFAFTTGTLRFEGVVLEDAVPDLERWYDVQIVIKDSSLAEEPFTASFAQGSRSDLASILGLTFGAKIKREGRIITLSRR